MLSVTLGIFGTGTKPLKTGSSGPRCPTYCPGALVRIESGLKRSIYPRLGCFSPRGSFVYSSFVALLELKLSSVFIKLLTANFILIEVRH